MNTERATNDNFITGLENWGKQLLVNQALEELTADIALAIQNGSLPYPPGEGWKPEHEMPRFSCEVAAPTQINVIDQDGAEYVVRVERK